VFGRYSIRLRHPVNRHRAISLLIALVGLLFCAQPALATPQGLVQGGYDQATRTLEGGFKVLSIHRVFSADECYPAPDAVATLLRKEVPGTQVVITPSLDSVQGFGVVNVISDETGCDRLVLAIRAGLKGRIFVLDSNYGPVYLEGGKGTGGESTAGGVGPLRDLTAATGDVQVRRADQTTRFAVNCPNGATPLGGGWFNATPVGADGSGLYSHSYERLGATSGFHVTATYVDPTRAGTPPRRALIQVVCGHGLVPTASPHATTYVHRHESASVTAHCPDDTQLFSGGFQRTNFTTPGIAHGGVMYGGDYITESRAVGNGWRVSGGAVDRNGGELTAIAYCADDPSLPVDEVSSSVSVAKGKAVSAVTPRCPEDRVLISGGFSFGDSHDALFASGYFTRNGTWAATGYGWFGSADLTAYGYCAEAQDTLDRTDFPNEPKQGPPAPKDSGSKVLYIVLGAVALIALLLFLRRRQVVRRRRARRRTRRR
jgi:hypothetical protein